MKIVELLCIIIAAFIVFFVDIPASGGDLQLPKCVEYGSFAACLSEEAVCLGKNEMYEHIDGEAEFFIRYGARELTYAYYGEGGTTVGVDIFFFDDPNGAYESFRTYAGCGEGSEDKLGGGVAVFLEGAVYGVKSNMFVRLFPSGRGSVEVARRIAEKVFREIPGVPFPRLVNVISTSGNVDGCVDYHPDNLIPSMAKTGGYSWKSREGFLCYLLLDESGVSGYAALKGLTFRKIADSAFLACEAGGRSVSEYLEALSKEIGRAVGGKEKGDSR